MNLKPCTTDTERIEYLTAYAEAAKQNLAECQDFWQGEIRRLSDLLVKTQVERDAAQANYQFMVNRAIDEKLDGYRELGAMAAAAEEKADTYKAAHDDAQHQISALTIERDFYRDTLAAFEAPEEIKEFDAWRNRADDAEAKLCKLKARCEDWAASNDSERSNGRVPTFLNPHTVLYWLE